MNELRAQVSQDAQQRRKNLQEALELQRQVAEAQAARDGAQKEVGRLFAPLRGTTELWYKRELRQGPWEHLWGRQEAMRGIGGKRPNVHFCLHPLSP